MIKVYFLPNEVAIPPTKTLLLLNTLPTKLLERYHKYYRWQDRQAYLLGKWLLSLLLQNFAVDATLHDLLVDNFQRPFINGAPDFNITHTNGLVACAMGTRPIRLGLDVEQHRTINLREFKRVFTNREFQEIGSASNTQLSFFSYWTKKEAIMKADGRGLFLDPAFDAEEAIVKIEQQTWYCQQLYLSIDFTGHIATNQKTEIQLFDATQWLYN